MGFDLGGLVKGITNVVAAPVRGIGNAVGGDIGKFLEADAQLLEGNPNGFKDLLTGGPKNYDAYTLQQLQGQQDRAKRFQQQRQGLSGQAGNVDQSTSQGFINTGINQLYSTAQNPQLTQAQQMAQAQMAMNAQQQQAMLRSQRGSATGAAQRMAGQQLAGQNQELIGQTAPLAAQEQMQAQNMAVQGLTNQSLQQRQYEMQLQDLAKQYEMMGLDKYQAQLQAQLYAKGIQAQNSAAEAALRDRVYGGALNAGAGIMMNSFSQSPVPAQNTFQPQTQAITSGGFGEQGYSGQNFSNIA